MEVLYKGYTFSDDQYKLQFDVIKSLLEGTYWASDRPMETIKTSIQHSIPFGIYKGKEQVGFGRVVTDYATMYWIADIVIADKHRGLGLGKHLMALISADERLKGLLGILATKDAHGLYQKYGFMKDPEKFMKKPRQ